MTTFDWVVFSLPALIAAFVTLGPGLQMIITRFGKGNRTIYGICLALCLGTVVLYVLLLSTNAKIVLSNYIKMIGGLGVVMLALFLWELSLGSREDKR